MTLVAFHRWHSETLTCLLFKRGDLIDVEDHVWVWERRKERLASLWNHVQLICSLSSLTEESCDCSASYELLSPSVSLFCLSLSVFFIITPDRNPDCLKWREAKLSLGSLLPERPARKVRYKSLKSSHHYTMCVCVFSEWEYSGEVTPSATHLGEKNNSHVKSNLLPCLLCPPFFSHN